MTEITPFTNPLAQPQPLDPEVFLREVYADGKQPVQSREIIERYAHALSKYAQVFAYDGPSAGGQVLLETNYFRFTGDVRPEQFNIGGIGATGGGVRGESFGSPEEGVLAFFLHLNTYFRGKKETWPVEQQALFTTSRAPRYQKVIDAGYAGQATSLLYLTTRWAKDPQYAVKFSAIANRLLGKSNGMKLVFAAGHHNTSGGNPRETGLTGELTETYYRVGRSLGHDVRVITPDGPDDDLDPGDGTFQGTLSDAAKVVVTWANQGWTADYFVELHFQGLTEGSDAGRGHFIIHPDWGTDIDTDVRDSFGPLWARIYQNIVGMPMWTDGVMSEKQTGVGLDGYRLGVFGATVAVKATTTRAIIEHGSHTSPADFRIISGKDFNQRSAEAFFVALHQYHNLAAPDFGAGIPKPEITPGAGGLVINGFWVIDEIREKWESLGENAYSILGPPKSGMFLAPVGGTERKVQVFEKGALAVYEEGTPHGVDKKNPFHVRNLLPWERIEVITFGRSLGLVAQDVV